MTFEEISGLTDNFFSITTAQNFTWQIGKKLTFSQHITGIFDPSDRENYILSARAKLDTDITPNLAWRIAWAWTKDNTPAATRKSTDTTLTTGIALKF
jgi:putative salt-induced outer membrane protein YdiY